MQEIGLPNMVMKAAKKSYPNYSERKEGEM